MSADGTPMTTMDRRELLKRIAYLTGGTLSAPLVLSVLNGCAKKAGLEWKPALFSEPQAAIVTDVVDIIIPRSDTPGAKDVGVPLFIDTILNEAFSKEDRDRYLTGLDEFEALAKKEHGRSFVELEGGAKDSFVRVVHADALANQPPPTPNVMPKRPFILMTKELTLLAFFTSEVGATQVLQYEAVPGRYEPCVPLSKAGNGKAWAQDGAAPT